jgi:hypothetical protein
MDLGRADDEEAAVTDLAAAQELALDDSPSPASTAFAFRPCRCHNTLRRRCTLKS